MTMTQDVVTRFDLHSRPAAVQRRLARHAHAPPAAGLVLRENRQHLPHRMLAIRVHVEPLRRRVDMPAGAGRLLFFYGGGKGGKGGLIIPFYGLGKFGAVTILFYGLRKLCKCLRLTTVSPVW
jgi:hypothetical protein